MLARNFSDVGAGGKGSASTSKDHHADGWIALGLDLFIHERGVQSQAAGYGTIKSWNGLLPPAHSLEADLRQLLQQQAFYGLRTS